MNAIESTVLDWCDAPAAALCQASRESAYARQMTLTKPPGSLGQLEQIAIDFAGWQGQEIPTLRQAHIRVYAGDHGVADEGVSAFPQAVTAEMVRNFSSGGAAICVLARMHGLDFKVVNVGTAAPLEDLPNVIHCRLQNGTANFCKEPAMSADTLQQALAAGRDSVPDKADLFIGGEMGIGNTTAAAAVFAAILKIEPESIAGRGTGVDDAGLQRKTDAIRKAISLHSESIASGVLGAMQSVGGLEIASLAGAYIACAQKGIPSLVDGFIATAAALCAIEINPDVRNWMVFAHCSDEAGHREALSEMKIEPILKIGLRLGEGSGAAVVYPLLQSALRLHAEMATFEQASVSTKSS